MPNEENIKPHRFKKGETGNPNGRPKKIPELDKLLADVLGEEKDGIEAAKAILMALRAKATKGDVRAAEVLLNRAYGKPKESVDLSSMGESLAPKMSPEQFKQFVKLTRAEMKKHADNSD